MVPKIAGTKAPFIETQCEVSLGFSAFDVVTVFLNSLNGSSWFKLPVKVTFEMKPRVEGGGGGGKDLGCKPLPFYIPFLIEKIPLSYSFHRKFYPFHIPTE